MKTLLFFPEAVDSFSFKIYLKGHLLDHSTVNLSFFCTPKSRELFKQSVIKSFLENTDYEAKDLEIIVDPSEGELFLGEIDTILNPKESPQIG